MKKAFLHSHSSVFLLELMINIVLFSIVITVCLRIYLLGYKKSQETTQLTHAIVLVQDVCDCFQSCYGDSEKMLSYFPNGILQSTDMTLYYDQDFQKSSDLQDVYEIRISFTSDHSLNTANIRFVNVATEAEIYHITTTVHIPYHSDSEIMDPVIREGVD